MERPKNSVDIFEFSKQFGALDETASLVIIRQIIQICADLHERNIFHRDIKDENILLNCETLETRLIDFGCATETSDLNQEFSRFAGTPEFTAPEYFLTGRLDQVKSTVWSIGCLFYVLLFGDIPFECTDDIQAGVRTKFDESKLSSPVKSLLDSMFHSNPANRVNFDQLLQHSSLNS